MASNRSIPGYSVEYLLGAGAYGEVFKASKDGEPYAIKQIKLIDIGVGTPTEIESLRGLSHKNVIKYIESFNDAFFLWIVLEYCNGGDLDKYIRECPWISYVQIFGFVQQLATGLEYLHSQHVIHRDIKPANIMVCLYTRNTVTLKFGDFGVARIWPSVNFQSQRSKYVSAAGTPYFQAPELRENKCTYASDIFSLGCVVMAMYSKTVITYGVDIYLVPYIEKPNGTRNPIYAARLEEKDGFIKQHVRLPGVDQSNLQYLVNEMVADNWRGRPRADQVATLVNDVVYRMVAMYWGNRPCAAEIATLVNNSVYRMVAMYCGDRPCADAIATLVTNSVYRMVAMYRGDRPRADEIATLLNNLVYRMVAMHWRDRPRANDVVRTVNNLVYRMVAMDCGDRPRADEVATTVKNCPTPTNMFIPFTCPKFL